MNFNTGKEKPRGRLDHLEEDLVRSPGPCLTVIASLLQSKTALCLVQSQSLCER